MTQSEKEKARALKEKFKELAMPAVLFAIEHELSFIMGGCAKVQDNNEGEVFLTMAGDMPEIAAMIDGVLQQHPAIIAALIHKMASEQKQRAGN